MMSSQGASVLIVDDDDLVLRALGAVFQLETNYVVSLQSDPLAALEIAAETPFDVVISDFLMPRMNGVRFLEEAHRLRPDAFLILLTGYSEWSRIKKAAPKLDRRYLEKPWSNEELLGAVRSALRRSPVVAGTVAKLVDAEPLDA
jgi:DNA-binding NtrC family response regulator